MLRAGSRCCQVSAYPASPTSCPRRAREPAWLKCPMTGVGQCQGMPRVSAFYGVVIYMY